MVVLTNARVFDGRAMLPGHATTSRSTASGSRRSTTARRRAGRATSIDVGGMTLMPGLITCHLHPDFYKFDIGRRRPARQGAARPA